MNLLDRLRQATDQSRFVEWEQTPVLKGDGTSYIRTTGKRADGTKVLSHQSVDVLGKTTIVGFEFPTVGGLVAQTQEISPDRRTRKRNTAVTNEKGQLRETSNTDTQNW